MNWKAKICAEGWKTMSKQWYEGMHKKYGHPLKAGSEAVTQAPAVEPRCPRAVTAFTMPMDFLSSPMARRLIIMGDSMVVMNWHKGEWPVKEWYYRPRALQNMDRLQSLRKTLVPIQSDGRNMRQHIYREQDRLADALGRADEDNVSAMHPAWLARLRRGVRLAATFDGGHVAGSRCGSAAWIIWSLKPTDTVGTRVELAVPPRGGWHPAL